MSGQFKIPFSRKRSIREIVADIDEVGIAPPIKKMKLNNIDDEFIDDEHFDAIGEQTSSETTPEVTKHDTPSDGEQSTKKIFAVFVCGPDPTQCVEDPTSPNQRGKTYVNLLQNEDEPEEWKEYMIYRDEFPSKQDLLSFSAIVITGSKHDAYTDDAEWKLRLQDIIRDIYDENNIKLLGVCFGHQIIAHSLRNTEGRNKIEVVGRNRTRAKMELGLISVDLTDRFHSFWSRFDIKVDTNALRIHEAHQDVVYALPSHLVDAGVMAYSQHTDVEMYHVGDNIVGVQGHPEFTTSYLMNAIKKNTKYMSKIYSDNELKDILDNMREYEANREEWKHMFGKWIRL